MNYAKIYNNLDGTLFATDDSGEIILDHVKTEEDLRARLKEMNYMVLNKKFDSSDSRKDSEIFGK